MTEVEEFEWFTLEDISKVESDDKLYCISVDSPDKQFLIGKLGVPTHNTEEAKAEDELKGEAAMIIGSIARLGRASGVHLVIATQRPDAKLINGETKENLHVRINAGRTKSTASSMILDNSEGTRVRPQPPGRLYLQLHGQGDHGQGFFASPSWIDEYLASKGLNPDGTPLSAKKSRLGKKTDMATFDGTTLDELSGVDNEGAIDKIRQQEMDEDFASTFAEADDDSDWGFGDDDNVDEIEADQEVERDGIGSLVLGQGEAKTWGSPVDDWDAELEDLIEENNR